MRVPRHRIGDLARGQAQRGGAFAPGRIVARDVQAVVNALWRAGARGMMLMDQRVVSTSAVRCVGNTLILQGRVYSPPFTIKAIGDPVKLKAALDDDEAVKIYKQYVDLVGLGYDVKTEQNASFPAFTGSLSLKYARAQR